MFGRLVFPGLVGAALLCANVALACGQVACEGPSRPGAKVQIRGYGYGFDGGDRPVTLRWIADDKPAGTALIDGNGDFSVQVVAPAVPGLHKLVVSLGDTDPAPIEVTVPVVLPWYRVPIAALRTLPVEFGVALGGVLIGVWGLLAGRQRSQQRRGETATG